MARAALVYPFPLWLLGAVAIIASRLWDARDKWAALGIQVAFTLIAAIAIAGLTARSGSLAGYARTVRIDGWDLIRAGSLVAAALPRLAGAEGQTPPPGAALAPAAARIGPGGGSVIEVMIAQGKSG